MLKDLQELVNELNTTNKTNDKIEILKKYPQCKQLLMYTYNPFYQFNVTSANLKKRKDLNDSIFTGETIVDVLDSLRKGVITGHTAIAVVNDFISQNKEYEDLIYKIIDKNLQTRTDAKLINKVYPKLVPQFEVALANKYEDYEKKINFQEDRWLASRKLDGVRCIIRKENGVVTCWSRQGKQFDTLGKLEECVRNLNFDNMVLDGEICLIKEGKEDFQGVMKEIRRKDHTIEQPSFMMFDTLTIEEFDSKKGEAKLWDRIDRISEAIQNATTDCYISHLDMTVVNDKEHLIEMMKEATSKGWEGLIIRKDGPYEGKRSKNLLKVKKMHDAEYVVEELEFGPYRVINKETGLEETIETLTNVFITHKGNKVGVGSGFTLDERRKYYENPDLIKGKIITVQYFEETKNQEGNYSLRFPVVKYIHGDKRGV